MLGVRRPENVAICIEGEEICQVAANGGEVGDHTIVHEDMAAEDEGVRVDLGDDAAATGSDMGEDTVSLSIFTE